MNWVIWGLAALMYVIGWFVFAVLLRRTHRHEETWSLVAFGSIWPAVLVVFVLLLPFLIMIKLVDVANKPDRQ